MYLSPVILGEVKGWFEIESALRGWKVYKNS
jgi:hypothetical protein